MDCQVVHHEEIINLSDSEPVPEEDTDNPVPEEESCFSHDNPPILSPCGSLKPADLEVQEYTSLDSESVQKDSQSADVIYDGGAPEDDDVEIKMLFDGKVAGNDENDVEIEVRGVKYKIPFAIECHLCTEMMNLCLRRTRYRGQTREYPAYRCNRKGCQTFRSIRKVFSNCVTDGEDRSSPTMIYQPALDTPQKSNHRGEFSEDDIDDYVVQRVSLPKTDKRGIDPNIKPMSVTDRVRRANQERAVVFSEFADQLRRDIAANKRIRVRKQINEEDEPQGTLFYISKELNPHEIIELQDAIIKTLISLRKIPPPMTMLDLPLFANCPYSKRNLEVGLESAKYREDFWSAFTNSPQPPLPAGFIRRKDDTLLYRDPKPYEVPEILQQNSPRKQAEATINYQQRKGEQDAKRMERRHTEKKFRSWASLKREFDMAETEGCSSAKIVRSMDDNGMKSDRKGRKITLQELIDRMEGDPHGRMTGKIKAGNSQQCSESMQWIDDNFPVDAQSSEELGKKSIHSEYRLDKSEEDVFEVDRKPKLHDSMRPVHNPSLQMPPSPTMRSFSSVDNGDLKNSPPVFFADVQFNNNQTFYSLSPYFNPYQMGTNVDPNNLYQNGQEIYQGVGASEVVHTEYPFTYIHPDSGVRLTDPSAFLTSFIPSPVTKLAPVNFDEDTVKSRRDSEPSTSSMNADDLETKEIEEIQVDVEDDKKIVDESLKFDPPSIE